MQHEAAASSAHQFAGTLALVRNWKAWNILSPTVVIYPWWAVVRKPNHSGHGWFPSVTVGCNVLLISRRGSQICTMRGIHWSERYILVLILYIFSIFIDSHPLKEREVREPESWDLTLPGAAGLINWTWRVTGHKWQLYHDAGYYYIRIIWCSVCDPWLGCSLGQIDLAWEVKWNYWNEICLSESSKYLHNNQYSHFHTFQRLCEHRITQVLRALRPFQNELAVMSSLEINELPGFYDIRIPHPACPSYPIIRKHPDAIFLIWLI